MHFQFLVGYCLMQVYLNVSSSSNVCHGNLVRVLISLFIYVFLFLNLG